MQLLRIKQAAKRLKHCEQTFRKRIKENGWPTYNLGKKGLLVDLDEILRLTREEGRSGCSKESH
jgi:hypothetical protein